MKKALFLTMALCFMASLALAQEAATTATPAAPAETAAPAAVVAPAEITLAGYIIDNKCATANKDKLEDFVRIHTKRCALLPACVASGYSIFSEGKLYKFDSASNAKIEEFLKKITSNLKVTVVAKEVLGELSLVSIENQ